MCCTKSGTPRERSYIPGELLLLFPVGQIDAYLLIINERLVIFPVFCEAIISQALLLPYFIRNEFLNKLYTTYTIQSSILLIIFLVLFSLLPPCLDGHFLPMDMEKWHFLSSPHVDFSHREGFYSNHSPSDKIGKQINVSTVLWFTAATLPELILRNHLLFELRDPSSLQPHIQQQLSAPTSKVVPHQVLCISK